MAGVPVTNWGSHFAVTARRWSVSSTSALTAVVAVAAALGVVFLLLSCGVAISRNAKATQVWGSRRRLSSREAEGPCEQTASGGAETSAGGEGAAAAADGEDATADGEDAAAAADGEGAAAAVGGEGAAAAANGEGAAGAADGEGGIVAAKDDTRGQAVPTSPAESTLDPMAAPFIPRGVSYAAEGADEGDRAAGGASAASSLEATASPAAKGAAAADEAPSAAGAGGVHGKTKGTTGEVMLPPPALWPGGVGKAIGSSPYLGFYLTRYREFADYCRQYLSLLSPNFASLIAEQLLRHAIAEFAAMTPLCSREEDRQRVSAIRAFFRLSLSVGGRLDRPPQTDMDRMALALRMLQQRDSIAIPFVTIQARRHATQTFLPPACAALRIMATAVNTLLQSLSGHNPHVPPSLYARESAIIGAVIHERLLQVLRHNGVVQMLQQLQSQCCPGAIFCEAHISESMRRYKRTVGHPDIYFIDQAAERAAARSAAQWRQMLAQQETAATGAAGWDPEGFYGGELAAGDGTEGWLPSTGPQGPQGGQQLQQWEVWQQQHGELQPQVWEVWQQQLLLQQPVPAVFPAEGAYSLPVAAAPESLQEWASAASEGQDLVATEEPEAAAPEGGEEGGMEDSLRFDLSAPPLPTFPFPRDAPPHLPLPQLLPSTATTSPSPPWHPSQVGQQQQPAGPRGPVAQQLQQQEKPGGPFPPPQQQEEPQDTFAQPQQQGQDPWGQLPQQQLHGGVAWGPSLLQLERVGPWGASPHPLQRDDPWRYPPQQPDHDDSWGAALPQQKLELQVEASGALEGEEGDSLPTFLESSGASAYVDALLSPDSSPDVSSLLVQGPYGREGSEEGETVGLFGGSDSTASVVLLAPRESASHGAHLQQQRQQQQQLPLGGSVLFRGSDYTKPLAAEGEVEERGAQLAPQQQQQQEASAGLGSSWSLTDIAIGSRASILRGPPHVLLPSTDRRASGQTAPVDRTGGRPYAEALKGEAKREHKSQSEEKKGQE
ncbi:LOW QUALITY PROTEIN: uncharacterized protein EMH_0024520 [Eimeria mitis]|uniref:Uncharacterized protein n=1 Tax=Eimeria mitis TaxID=44415 RepID=U6KAZ8_9EIME|nr:LOW QUALITY PROTEIN: uncharacterized protein EMH_0024520 [Eimeria mitis]CDJ35205.1 hypothetical protein, conserved [Eimeria mitis]